MTDWISYVVLAGAIGVSFWTELVEATYLSVRPLYIATAAANGDPRATKATQIIQQKTKLVSSTTLNATFADVIIASFIAVISYDTFGLTGFLVGTVVISLLIMVFLDLLPKAIGIENSARMALAMAPSTSLGLRLFSPVAVLLTSLVNSMSESIMGKPAYEEDELEEEFEGVLVMLEKAEHIHADSGRLLRSTLASSKTTALDILTPMSEIVSVGADRSVADALKLMGNSNHPNLPVYDVEAEDYVGAVTFRSLFRAFADGTFDDNVRKHMVTPARVELSDTIATIMDKIRSAGVTMALVMEGKRVIGMITITDILEAILGIRA